jgi:hypothetical protein
MELFVTPNLSKKTTFQQTNRVNLIRFHMILFFLYTIQFVNKINIDFVLYNLNIFI